MNTFDAIVIGSGISGGWAAKELTEKGLKTLVLERGRNVEHGEYPTAMKAPWELPHADKVPPDEIEKNYSKQSRSHNRIKESTKHWFVKDNEHPYREAKRFDWIRGYHVGGRSIMWGRQSYRWSDLDFEANLRDGIGIDWPIRYKDIDPWYSYVEGFAGIQGQKEGLPQLPDGNFLPPMEMNCVEKVFRKRVADKFRGRVVTVGRTANLTQNHNGRTRCQYRDLCGRGCPYGGYFSSNSATLPVAAATGNLTVRPYSVVSEIIYDAEKGKAKGVRIIDSQTKEEMVYYSKIIFCCASTAGSTSILLNSKSEAFPNGMGNQSGELGHNLMDHHFKTGAGGLFEGFEDKFYIGRRPTGIYVPRFRNVDKGSTRKDYVRGFGYQGGAGRESWTSSIGEMNFGGEFKDSLSRPGSWRIGLGGFGECLPYHENKMSLDYENKDPWGLPTIKFNAEFKENEKVMRKDMGEAAAEMLQAAGVKEVKIFDHGSWPGQCIHEMGTARMGRDPKTSVLNKWNQIHEVPNVFVTDGACMASSACVNPSLTYMALTARAADYAVKELNRQNL